MSNLKAGWRDCCPKRRLDWEEGPGGHVVVLRPRFGSSAWGQKLTAVLGVRAYKIRLDDVGTVVWRSLDGHTPLSEVAERLKREFGTRVEPAEDRLLQFVRQMARARLIEL